MQVFDLPYSTEVNKVIPKNAFETYSSPKQKKTVYRTCSKDNMA
jgi:hypothetical protein